MIRRNIKSKNPKVLPFGFSQLTENVSNTFRELDIKFIRNFRHFQAVNRKHLRPLYIQFYR